MDSRGSQTNRVLVILVIALVLVFVACGCGWVLIRLLPWNSETEATPQAQQDVPLTVAYSPEKEELFTRLVAAFNAQTAGSSETLPVVAVRYEPDLMIEAALAGQVQAISPDSSVWLDVLDREWAEQTGRESPLVGLTERYAVSPIVIATWQDVAASMGYPDKALGWSDLLNRARSDPEFKWSHPSTTAAAGLLATLAQFYAGAQKTRGLTAADAQQPAVLDYVAAVEKTVRYYGEGEWSVIQRVLGEGRSYLDAFVCQEQLIVYHNAHTTGERLVAIYPVDGTLWEDHPLALLEIDGLTDKQRATFGRFVQYLKSRETQTEILRSGYRPTDLSISLNSPDSPLTLANGIDPTQPKTALQMPSPSVVQVVRDVWWYTKRHTNVYLVVDVSGSMQGDKLENAQQALRVFMDQIRGDLERVGMITFSTRASDAVPIEELGQNRSQLVTAIDRLEAQGDTALLDAVELAYSRLQDENDRERINAIVVMTDGRENNSRVGLSTVMRDVMAGNADGVPVLIFCIGYGGDADEKTLRALAESSGGQYYTGDLETIRRLYKILSSYF